ncbi:putative baseplate assembly protein [Ralstonia solanacearum K60]|uniref:Baseplate assembly protein n=1 Tax=Ralstonia solanacearum K60 TaxID=1091042 RepID=A0AAP8D224_RALSL|nr:putative baseplate assembly protein [Ralstonia solanacearum]OYQ09384.1 putative baseplate assembly protein [Ralstonia solanacearum K60]
MKCSPRPPILVSAGAQEIAQALSTNRKGYTPEWRAGAACGDAGSAIDAILARYLEIQADGLNAMPQRLQLEYLDALGACVLAPQPARAPLVFTLLASASGDATVPQGTRVAAVLPPPAPSLVSATASTPAVAPEFYTEQEITATRGTLAALYSIDPQADLYADHGAVATTGFTVFDAMVPVPHRLYLGHGELFKFTDSAQIDLSFDFANAGAGHASNARRPLLLDWEYLSTDGWQPLTLVDDSTERFTVDGKITLAKFFGPDSKVDSIGGHDSCWIRGTVSSRTPHARIAVEPAGYLVQFTPNGAQPVSAGKEVHVKGQSVKSTVLEVVGGRLILAAPLTGAAANAELRTDVAAIGTVLSAPPAFRIAVESTRDLMPGDVVTLDGAARATILQTDGTSLYLSAALAGAQPGLTVELADALPPLRPDGADADGALPQVDVIRARVGFGKSGLALDSAYVDDASLDISKDFSPFGEQPARFASFYATCKEAFSRDGAQVELAFTFNQAGSGSAQVVAEFFSGAHWQPLGPSQDYLDDTHSLTFPQSTDTLFPHSKIRFTVPAGWAETEINGDKGRWLRLRIASGDYGHPLSVDVTHDPADPAKFIVNSVASTLTPPIVAQLVVNYDFFTNPQPADFCVTENDFAFAEHSDEARWPRSAFAPFTPVADRTPAVHFGFSSQPPAALVSLLAHVLVPAPEGDPQPFAWDYWGSRGWTPLSVRDATLGLRRTGLIQFVGADDALPREGLGGALYRIRARLKSGLRSQDQIVQCGGAWLNAVWGRQGQYIARDGLGTSNGNPDQTFALAVVRAQKAAPVDTGSSEVIALNAAQFERALDTPLAGVPILDDEVLEVREWVGRGDDWQTTLAGVPPADLRFEVDPQDPTVMTAAWVRWHAQPHLYRSGPADRHYLVERARGIFSFPGAAGFIPPAGAPIVVSYVTGGGADGNVPAGAVRELRSGVGFVQSVSNPIPSGGGAAAELLRPGRDRGSQQVRNRGRAVSREDYEWLALGASSEVARVRALPLESADGHGARGCVGIVLVPHSQQAQPLASPELERTVLDALAQCAPAGIAGGIRMVDPSYVAVGVRAEILPLNAQEAGRIEALVRTRLQMFLHPLAGGHDGHGWDFGQSVYLSDLASLIENTPGVDAVRFLQLMVGQTVFGDSVPLQPHQLIAAGDSELMIIVPSLPYALA